jgi:hypothetical protein
MNIYVRRGGTTYGPYTEVQAREYLKQGVFAAEDLACREGESEWQPFSTIIPPQPTKPAATTRPASEHSRSTTATAQPARKLSTPLIVFGAIFLGLILAGGTLMIAWPTVETLFERNRELSGEVFIVTKGGQNYKLGLVPIALYSLETLKRYLDQKKQQAQTELARLGPLVEAAKSEMDAKNKTKSAAFDAWLHSHYSDPNRSALEAARNEADKGWKAAMGEYYRLLSEQSKLASGAFYFVGLPEPLVTTQTNSDGKFTVEMPTKGNLAIAANAHRSVGDSTEHYYWLIKVSLGGAAKKAMILSNNNLTSEGSSDSLITTSN